MLLHKPTYYVISLISRTTIQYSLHNKPFSGQEINKLILHTMPSLMQISLTCYQNELQA
jgi:hypothetical protein